MISYRFLIHLFLMAFSPFLYGEVMLQYHCGISYPGGFVSGLGLEGKDFDTSFSVQYSQDAFDLLQFTFRSEYISLGSVTYSGIPSVLKGAGLGFSARAEPNRPIIDTDGNPVTNFGVIFTTPAAPLGLTAFRRIDYSGGLFWFEPAILSRGTLFLSQSFRTVEDQEIDESWYLDESPLFSIVHMHSLVSLVLGDDSIFGGGTIILNWSREDRGGFSLLLLGGISFPFLEFQSELLWTSPSYVDFDLDSAGFPLIWKTSYSFPDLSFLLESDFSFQLGKDSLPRNLKEIRFENENRIDYSSGFRSIEGEIDWSWERTEKGEWNPQVSLDLNYRRDFFPFYWEGGAKGEYRDNLFHYLLSLSTGVDDKSFDGEISISLEIDNKVLLHSGVSLKYATDKFSLSGKAELLDIGIYNTEDVLFKPSFSLELKVNQLLSP